MHAGVGLKKGAVLVQEICIRRSRPRLPKVDLGQGAATRWCRMEITSCMGATIRKGKF